MNKDFYHEKEEENIVLNNLGAEVPVLKEIVQKYM